MQATVFRCRTKRRITPEPVIVPRYARTRWAPKSALWTAFDADEHVPHFQSSSPPPVPSAPHAPVVRGFEWTCSRVSQPRTVYKKARNIQEFFKPLEAFDPFAIDKRQVPTKLP
jgi:hypothetical protein